MVHGRFLGALTAAALATALAAGPAGAAPVINSVSGAVTHGASVSIAGSQFGSKETAAPYRYDDFESGTVGQILRNEANGGWTTDGIIKPVYSTDKARKAGGKSAYQNFTNGCYNSTIALWNFPDRPMYFSGWFNYKMWGAVSRNNKLIQIRSGQLEDPAWEARFGADGTSAQQYIKDCGDLNLSPFQSNYCSYNGFYADEQWHRMEFYMDQGNQNTANGVWTIWVDGVQWSTLSGQFMQSGDCPFYRMYLGFYFATDTGSPQPQAQRYWDEIYVDTTRARVELGNASTWAACTQREVQVPTSWSSNGQAISFRVNQGTLANGSRAWVYVVDASGVANSTGFEVTLGGTDPGAPGAPGKPVW